MYTFFKNAHTYLGMAVLYVLAIVFLIILIRFLIKKPFDKISRVTALIGLVIVALQLALGWIIYFISPLGITHVTSSFMKNTTSRFFILEHPLGMIIALALIINGYKRTKKDISDSKKYKTVLLLYGIALAIIIYLIPWFIWK